MDSLVDLIVGEERFLRLADVVAVEVDSQAVVAAEVLPTGEVMLTAKSPGRALMFLADTMKTAAWRVRVREMGGKVPEVAVSGDARAAAAKTCPGLKEEPSPKGASVEVIVSQASCRRALKRLFEADAYRTGLLDLTFTVEVLQDQLRDFDERLAAHGVAGLKLRYQAATLVVEGVLPREARARLARALYEGAAGRVAVDLRVEETADAGTAPPSSKEAR